MAAPKPRKSAARKPPPTKELRPWQLALFVVLGLIIAGTFVGVGYSKKSKDEYGQYPWARTAVPPKMFYDQRNYKTGAPGSLPAQAVRVGKSPGGGIIFATTTAKKPVPTVIWVQNPKTHAVSQYPLSGGP
jgi:hypothetical protein